MILYVWCILSNKGHCHGDDLSKWSKMSKEETAREEVSSTLLGSMPMPYFNHAACIYDMWIILLDAVIITPLILVAPVNNIRSSITFTCLSPIGQNEGGIVSI